MTSEMDCGHIYLAIDLKSFYASRGMSGAWVKSNDNQFSSGR